METFTCFSWVCVLTLLSIGHSSGAEMLDRRSLIETFVKKELAALEKRLKADEASAKQTISDLKDEVKQLKEADKKQKQCTGSRVAFTVGLKSGSTVSVSNIVVYNWVIYNLGNAYSPATGTFTCPVAGLYAFMVNVMSAYKDKDAYFTLRRNGVRVTYSYVKDKDYYGTGSLSATMHLDVGDTVDVQSYVITSSLWVVSTRAYNTFSGVLLSADTCM